MSRRTPPSNSVHIEGTLAERFHVVRYGHRHWALYEKGELVAVTLYKKGAVSVKSRLETHEETIAEQQRQIEALTTVTPVFRHKAARPAEQLPLIAAEALDVYRVTRPKEDTPKTP